MKKEKLSFSVSCSRSKGYIITFKSQSSVYPTFPPLKTKCLGSKVGVRLLLWPTAPAQSKAQKKVHILNLNRLSNSPLLYTSVTTWLFYNFLIYVHYFMEFSLTFKEYLHSSLINGAQLHLTLKKYRESEIWSVDNYKMAPCCPAIEPTLPQLAVG